MKYVRFKMISLSLSLSLYIYIYIYILHLIYLTNVNLFSGSVYLLYLEIKAFEFDKCALFHTLQYPSTDITETGEEVMRPHIIGM